MRAANPVEDLFPEKPVHGKNVAEIFDDLGRHGIQNLAYDGDPGCNPGYIFRGEADFDCPLQCSIERDWRCDPRSSATVTGDQLIGKERTVLEEYLKNKGPHVARMIDPKSGGRSWDEIWWWLSLMQHYRERTRLIDFTRDIRIALYFAVEQHEGSSKEGPGRDLIIYCLPCRDLKHPHDPDSNKCPYRPTEKLASVDMNLAIGRKIGLPWMERHKGWFPDKEPEKYYRRKQQKWGWDRPFYENPRLRFQKGMFVYPYDYPIQPLEKKSGASWLVQNLRQAPDSLSVSSDLPPKRIRIPAKHADSLKHHLKDRYHLTRGTVYLDPAAAD